MKTSAKEMTMNDKKADILTEYQRLRNILKQIHCWAALYSVTIQPDCNVKSTQKKSKPSNDIDNPTSMHAISINDDKDVIGRVKCMAKKPIGRLRRLNANATDIPNLAALVSSDANITKRRQKIKQECDVQPPPLRRSTRQRQVKIPKIVDYKNNYFRWFEK